MSNANLEGANLIDTNLTGATVAGTVMSDGSIHE
ncbi:pentapeptide repeat-containing protein [Microcoleus sp. N3A4]